ncbi:hypothetical protein BBP40_004635 [Aspergillus hancockii]|nr:hypothetical protein BBP40_004635 [Aspergillus hancockii]
MKLNIISVTLMAATVNAWTVETPASELEGKGTIECTVNNIDGPGKISNLSKSCFFVAYDDDACLGEIVAYAPEGVTIDFANDARSYVVHCEKPEEGH